MQHPALFSRVVALSAGIVSLSALPSVVDQNAASPQVIDIESGALTLRAQLWRPPGSGPFPAVLFNHGSYTSGDPVSPGDPENIGSVFARHNYVFLWLHRQGTGLSKDRGTSDGDQMMRAFRTGGDEARNRLQLQLLEHEAMNEATAALARLRTQPGVAGTRIALVGHSFGGSLSLLMAERDHDLRGAVIFGGGAGSWMRSSLLRERLRAAVGKVSAPVMFVHAENDYSTEPGRVLSAEMQRLGTPHLLKMYPAFGPDPRAGHNFLFGSIRSWEADVFAFLDANTRP
jgi:carboxymethylenebutenolidase